MRKLWSILKGDIVGAFIFVSIVVACLYDADRLIGFTYPWYDYTKIFLVMFILFCAVLVGKYYDKKK